MLVIRGAQLEALEADRVRRFENDAVSRLRERFPLHGGGDEELRDIVRAAERLGAESGIDSDRGIETLAAAMLCHGTKFFERHDAAWAKRLLFDSDAPGDVRATIIGDAFAAGND